MTLIEFERQKYKKKRIRVVLQALQTRRPPFVFIVKLI